MEVMRMLFVTYMILVSYSMSQPLTARENSLFGLCSSVEHNLLHIQRIENAALKKRLTRYDGQLQTLKQQVEHMNEKLQYLNNKYDRLEYLLMETGMPTSTGISADQFVDQDNQHIAFYAAVSVDTETNPVVFDKVYLNDGDCYDNTTGIFKCSVSGVYHITWSVETFGEVDVGTILEVNGEEFGYTWTDSEDQQYDTSTGIAILRLQAGDIVKVTLQSGSKIDARQSTFTGHILFP
ncbi:complement C1q-like protein 2 [Ylistrum balloti]|uniref:complement C1q-like protein 2 n=1 Tax=Ylistrum balloti TaxID=509963 RepID=UPI002905A4D0|nr:complement C1q-like protein 2 [Ylistrum balloti]